MLAVVLTGCAPHERLTFPVAPISRSETARAYDVNGDGVADFALFTDRAGRLDHVAYDDDGDGVYDRTYRLDDEDPATLPHLVILLDSVPYRTVMQRFERGDWPWFGRPAKVIPPFPTMSGVIFTEIVHAPPLPGVINRYFDKRTNAIDNRIFARVCGDMNAWQRRLHYAADYLDDAAAFLNPKPWYAAELVRAKKAFDCNPDRVTVAYIASSSAMLSIYGEDGANEVLDGLTQLCLQLLYERHGVVRISVMADHGHNYRPGRRVDIEQVVRELHFRPTERLKERGDVVCEVDGLVNYVGLHTREPRALAEGLAKRAEVQLVSYLSGDKVVVLNEHGSATIEQRDGRYRYTAVTADVLKLSEIAGRLPQADGFIAAEDWLRATMEAEFPDAPQRLWHAFHGLVVSTPDVMATLRDDWCIGLPSLSMVVDMKSTHGGLDQVNSATFLMTTPARGRAALPTVVRSGEALRAVEPAWEPTVLRRER
jgi:hypothetical protein